MGYQPSRPRRRFDLSRAVFYVVVGLVSLGTAFGLGVQAGADHNAAYRFSKRLSTTLGNSVSVTAGELASSLRARPTHFLQISRYSGEGVTVNDPSSDQNDLILMAGFFTDTNELRLIRRTGAIVARWPVRFYDLFPDPAYFPPGWEPASNWNIDLHGALALPDGSVLFNFEWGGLAKLDRCGKVVWTVRRQTHHSVERAEGGGFWVLARRLVTGSTPYPPFQTPFHEDTVLKVSEDGRVLAEFSPVKAFYDSSLSTILTATGSVFQVGMDWDEEIVHMNKVEELRSELASQFPMFEAGDLLLSLRDRNLVAVVDKNVSRVKWWQIGPWVRQHDPEFARSGMIVLFNDNAYQTAFGGGEYKILPDRPRLSNIMEVDPSAHSTRVIYGERPGQELLSVIKGKVDMTPRGGLFITEAQGGRVRETDATGRLVWEYVNRYSDTEVAELGEARLYPSRYFTVKEWACR
jgi:hypothetical protein